MQSDEMDFEGHVADAFRAPIERRDHVAEGVLAEVARTDQRRRLALALGALIGSGVAASAAALTGLVPGLGRLASGLSADASASFGDPSLTGALTWTAALLAATLVTAVTVQAVLQDS